MPHNHVSKTPIVEKQTRNIKAVLLIFLAGIILIQSHVIGGPGIIGTIGDYLINESVIKDQMIIDIIIFAIWFSAIIGSFGGVTVIVGGILVFFYRKFVGKFVVGLGTGMGIIGLSILSITHAYAGIYQFFGWLLIILHSSGWIGILLTIYGRMIVK